MPPKGMIKKYNELSEDQIIAKKVIEDNVITILTGSAGTGKTRLATTYALEKMATSYKSNRPKTIITRPTVFKKEDAIGFLPGDITEKYNPWVKPIYDVMYELEGTEGTAKLLAEKKIEILPMMFVQGITFVNSIVILDEAQNMTKSSMEMLFTRIGKNSQLILCGDDRQSLLEDKQTGLIRLLELVGLVDGLATCKLTTNFRHKIVHDLLRIY